MLKATGTGVIAAGLSSWTLVGRVEAAQAALAIPPNLPPGVVPYLRRFENWAGDIVTESLWTVTVLSEQQVVDLANWACSNGYRLRASGFSHNWSPLTVDGSETRESRVLLVDTRTGLTRVSVGAASVTVGAGVSMDTLLSTLDLTGKGLAHNPAPGDITVAGALAIGAHGTVVAALGETMPPGHSHGSLPNLVQSLRAVVWDAAAGRYLAKTFTRDQREIGALLVHVGRAFITQVTLRIGPKQRMRCRSLVSVPAAELLASPGSGGRTFASYVESAGRVELIWFPFTNEPWLKVWSLAPSWPWGSRITLTPYNYPFADNAPDPLVRVLGDVENNPEQTPEFTATQLSIVNAGLLATGSADLWGSGANLLRYVRPGTLKVTANGYAVLCTRADIQWVVSTFSARYQQVLAEYRARGQYPVNGPMEIRVTAVDDPADSGVPGAVDAWLSPTRRRPDRPEWTCAVWLDLLTIPGTGAADDFYTEIEEWLWTTFDGSRAAVRVEWSKGWGYTPDGAWTSEAAVSGAIPESLTTGQPVGTGFADAVAVLNTLDPHRIYVSPLLDRLMP
jgi:FAD/FMN-containing dehydrogenase